MGAFARLRAWKDSMVGTGCGRAVLMLALLTCVAPCRAGATEAPAADDVASTCPNPDIREFDADAEESEDSGRGRGFTYSAMLVDAKGALAPFDRIQKDFVARQKARFAAVVKTSSAQLSDGKNMLGISFELSRSGDFASMEAETSSTLAGFPTERTFAGWLLHMPSKRILAFDDLFVDPQAMHERVAARMRPYLFSRFKGRGVVDEAQRQQTAAAIEQRILEVTDPARSAQWQVTLDHADACEPGLLLTFDGSWLAPLIIERAEARLTFAGIRPLLKPEFRDALGERTEKIPDKPAFSSEIVARQFPDLMEVSSQHLLPLAELQPDLVDCSGESPESFEADPPSADRIEWMYNGFYRWRFAVHGDGTCVVLLYPEQRGLSRDEGQALLSAAKRKLPFDESKLDPAFVGEYRWDMAQTFGGFPAFEHGSMDGVDYAIGFMGLDTVLQPLDVIQRRSAREEIAAMAKLALRHRPGDDSNKPSAKLRMNFFSGGRTAELAVLAVEGRRSFAGGPAKPFAASWMLHVPSGKLIEFDELFVDPATVRKRISEAYRRNIPSRMGGRVTFQGDDAGKKEAIYRDTYRRAAYRQSTPTRNHFKDVRFNADAVYPGLVVNFSEEILPGDDTAYGGASLKSLRPHLKREYIHAFDPAGAPQPATVKEVGGG